MQKYENVVRELQYEQNQELIRLQKSIELNSCKKTTKMSTYASSSKVEL